MRLVNANYGLDFQFVEGVPEILVLETEALFRDIAQQLWNQCSGEEGEFILSDRKILKLDKKVSFIANPFELDFKNRKICSALYSKMTEIGNEKVLEKSVLNAGLINLIEMIASSVNYPGITLELDFAWADLFKLYDVKIEAPENFLLRLIEYMKVMASLCGINCFCFLNLKNYLSKEELLIFYKEASYNKINLLLIESFESEHIGQEHITIIDKDLCVIRKI